MMLDLLKNRDDFKEACAKAGRLAVKGECTMFVAYVARYDKWRVTEWVDDATVCRFDESTEIEWI